MRKKCRECQTRHWIEAYVEASSDFSDAVEFSQVVMKHNTRLREISKRIKEYTDPLKGEVAETVNKIASE